LLNSICRDVRFKAPHSTLPQRLFVADIRRVYSYLRAINGSTFAARRAGM
jgi:hypothetical protein